MITRFWWPIQSAARKQPALMTAFTAIVTAALWWPAIPYLQSLPQRTLTLLAGLIVFLFIAARQAGIAIMASLAILCGMSFALRVQATSESLRMLLTAAVAMLIPMLITIRQRSDRMREQTDLGRASAFVAVAMQFAAIGLWMSDWRLSVCVAVIGILAIFLPSTWWRTAESGNQIVSLQRLPQGSHQALRLASSAILVLGAIFLCRIPPEKIHALKPTMFAGLVMMSLWFMASGSLRTAVNAGLGIVGGLGWSSLASTPADPSTAAAALGVSQLPGLLVLMRQQARGGWPQSVTVLVAITIVLGFVGSDAQFLAASWCVASWLALTMSAQSGQAINIWHRLDPYWRCYGLAKLTCDPVYGQLKAERRAWGRVLDLGCGPGLVASLCAKREDVGDYIGIDLDHEKLLVARKALSLSGKELDERWKLWRAALPLGQPLPTADTAFLIDVLHYWPREQQLKILSQCRAALSPDGRLYLRDGCADTVGNTGRVGLGERFTTFFGLNAGGDGLHFLSESEMRTLVAQAGFDVNDVKPSGAENRFWILAPHIHATVDGERRSGDELSERTQ